ncbi:hypothetical protein DFQ10_108188 [Winogradskyella eximia]|uniref:Uncharacterized protein n=2 Tax=Winogradskyella eximia TaxID=262006 RepID=A0A3D9H0V2_9FLAO|nr:hypothetical protein DFQ10_108188 [Winogradskyella eximia]
MNFTIEMKQVRNFSRIVLFLCCTHLVIGCKNYYNDTIDWMDNLEPNSTIETVKESQPKFVHINWNDPEKVRNENRYYIREIKGSYDPLGMSHILVFIDGKFDRRESHK